MVKAKEVKLVMSPGELRNRLRKTMDRAPQPGSADRLPAARIRAAGYAHVGVKLIGARIELESDEIGGRLCAQSPVSQQVRFWREVGRRLFARSRFGLRTDHSNRDRIAPPRRACQCACRSTARSCEAASPVLRTLPSST